MQDVQTSIGSDAAKALAETKWWEGMSPRQIAEFQLFTTELCCPFSVFAEAMEAMEATLGRGIQTVEYGCNFDGLVKEIQGEKSNGPTFYELIAMVPGAALIPAVQAQAAERERLIEDK